MTLTGMETAMPRVDPIAGRPGGRPVHVDDPVHVLVVGDRSSSVAEGLRQMCAIGEMSLRVAEVSPLGPAAAVRDEARPTAVLIDLRPGADRALRRRALPELARRFGAVRVIALVGPDGSRDLHELLSLKVGGILNHDSDPLTVVRAIRAVLAGYTFHDFRQRAVCLADAAAGLLCTLSPREGEVIRLLVAGHTNREIGEAMLIAESTVRGHVKSLFHKIGARNRVQLAFLAGTHGLL